MRPVKPWLRETSVKTLLKLEFVVSCPLSLKETSEVHVHSPTGRELSLHTSKRECLPFVTPTPMAVTPLLPTSPCLHVKPLWPCHLSQKLKHLAVRVLGAVTIRAVTHLGVAGVQAVARKLNINLCFQRLRTRFC